MIAALIASGIIFWESADISTNTGVAPQFTILDTEARNVRDVTMTSSPFLYLRQQMLNLALEFRYLMPPRMNNQYIEQILFQNYGIQYLSSS